MNRIERLVAAMAVVAGCARTVRGAAVSWDGGGGADARWTTAANWAGDEVPAFDGTDDVTITTVNAAGTLMDLDGDKHINSLTSANVSPNFIISNSTLRVNTFVRKGNQAQMRIASDIVIDGTQAAIEGLDGVDLPSQDVAIAVMQTLAKDRWFLFAHLAE